MLRYTSILVSFILLFWTTAANALTCPDVSDVYIDQYEPNTNFNNKIRVLISYHPTKGIARGLMKFDIPSGITASMIQSATLYLSSSGHTGSGNAMNIGCYALNASFDETTDTWNSLSGGNYDNSSVATGALPSGNDWKTTVDMKNLLVGNLTKVRANGMLIKLATEGPDKLYQHIASKECDNETNPNYVAADEPPGLEITLYPDADGDGIANSSDNCPYNCNSQQLDGDNDGIGDVCDTTPGCGGCGQPACETQCNPSDTDGDGVPDSSDNCPNNCNSQQLDADNDGIGDVCDTTPGCGGCGQAACETEC